MRNIRGVRLVVGAILLAAGLFAVMALPGFLSGRDSTVSQQQVLEARQ